MSVLALETLYLLEEAYTRYTYIGDLALPDLVTIQTFIQNNYKNIHFLVKQGCLKLHFFYNDFAIFQQWLVPLN